MFFGGHVFLEDIPYRYILFVHFLNFIFTRKFACVIAGPGQRDEGHLHPARPVRQSQAAAAGHDEKPPAHSFHQVAAHTANIEHSS